MPDRVTAEPKPENQEIVNNGFQLPLSLIPQTIRRFFVSNIFQRSFAQLLGWTGSNNVLISATSSGLLNVAATGTTFTHNITNAGNAPDAYGVAADFTRVCPSVDIFTWNFAAVIKTSIDDVTYEAEVEIPANFFYSFPQDTRYIKIKNKVAGSVCRYQFIGRY